MASQEFLICSEALEARATEMLEICYGHGMPMEWKGESKSGNFR